uniref:Uncharacterized protein n=1 Tax=Oryza rufipogon TaxID=4529 RepID=A0A0E0Q3E3_ORYRU
MAYEVAEGVIRYHGLVCDKPSLCLLHNDTNPEQQSLQSLLHGCSNNITMHEPMKHWFISLAISMANDASFGCSSASKLPNVRTLKKYQ